MFSVIKNAVLGIRIPLQELAENVVREQLRLRGIDPATIYAAQTAGDHILDNGFGN